jgi:long-chain acyl-CoA synthetase
VLKDGWLYTGDLGHLDADNFLTITGRKKEILVTLGGKNIAPVYLESLLTQDPLILQALVVGDDRPCLAALIVPNPDVLQAEIVRLGITAVSRDEALTHPHVLALYEERIADRLKEVSPFEQVRRFALMPRSFTIDAGEMTAKLTLRRKVIERHFAAEIESLYRRG